jgi:serine/threonine protein kinase
MGDERRDSSVGGLEWVLTQLVERESSARKTVAHEDEVTLRDLEERLETLVSQIRQPPPVDDFAEESGCRRAVELVERLADDPAQLAPPPTPDRIGPYEVLARLRQGGMGTVFKALHPKLQRVVAIKVLPKLRTRDPAAAARFEREILALGSLSHRNIVAATDAGEADGMQYLVMEYVDGIDLSTLSRRVGSLEVADACAIIRQAADGVSEAHRRGIIHRDIKPSNLILVDNGEPDSAIVKVLDFGLARLAAEFVDDDLTASGQIMGTLKYMAPEQCTNSRDVDARADVYSLGATLYRLLTGQSPFSGARYDSAPALVVALAQESPERLRTLRENLPASLVAIVECAMAKDPAKRYATPSELGEALVPWSRGANLASLLRRGQAAEDHPDKPRLFLEPSSQAAVQSTPQVLSPKPKSWGAALLVGGALLGLIALAGSALLPATPGARAPRQTTAPKLDPGVDPAKRSREVAEWVLARKNSKVIVKQSDSEPVEVQAGERLPEGPFQLIDVNLDGDRALRDTDLARLDQLTELTSLGLSHTPISDQGFEQLGYLPALQNLFAVETELGDTGVAALEHYPLFALIHAYGADITDRGLKRLAAHNRQLTELSLVECPITDKGLAELSQLRQLRLLAVDRTGVTAAGVARLQRALPECEIRCDFSAAEIAAAAGSDE